jgi:hypothetical protein
MRSVSGVARQAFRLAHHSAAFTAKVYAHGTDGELAPDWATAPLKVVVDRSFRSGETTPGVDDEPDNSLPELREVERETGIEPIGTTASAPSAWEGARRANTRF